MKCYIISKALIAQLVEQQVSTLKVVGSSLAEDKIVFNICLEHISSYFGVDELAHSPIWSNDVLG